MKKTFLLSMCMLCMLSLVKAQLSIIDDADQGTGLNQNNYVGAGWIHGTTTNTFYNSTHSASRIAGAYAVVTFEGKKFEWYTEKKNTHGIAAISIDGGAEILIDLYSSTEQHLIVYTSPLLSTGTHTFKIRATGTKNPASTNYYAIHDYLLITGPGSPPFEFASNTALGVGTLSSTNDYPPGGNNSAFGYNALHTVFLGGGNTAVGANALTGVGKNNNNNTAVGSHSLFFGVGGNYGEGGNTAIGAYSLDTENTGASNTAIGYLAGPINETFMYNSTALGTATKTTASNQVRIGNPQVTSIGGQVSWSTLSDGRFKKNLQEDVSGLEFVNKLRPVSYTVDNTAVQRYLGIPDSVINSRFASKEQPIRQTGFVAQEVEKLVKKSGYVFSGVDVPKDDKDLYAIRYAEFVVPLVKAVQELSAKVEEQQKQIEQLLTENGIDKDSTVTPPSDIFLLQNDPNPFSANTEIKMVLPETVGNANIIVYSLEGKQLKDVIVKERGDVSITISGNELNAGMYIYALIVDGKIADTKRMILTK